MSSSALSIFVVGGHGKVALHFTRLAVAKGHKVLSMIRQPEHRSDLPKGDVEPILASLEESSVSDLASLFRKHSPNVVLFASGAGGKGGPERTKAVDQDGAIKVFDAIEESGIASSQDFRRLLLISAVDVRDRSTAPPSWYGEDDKKTSDRMWDVLAAYMAAKYAADKNLSQRKSFPWTVLRPGSLLDDAGTGRVALADHRSLVHKIPREDVGAVLLALAELDKGKADGLMLNLLAGSDDIATAVKGAVERNRSDFEE